MIIHWEVEDGYAGKARPQSTEVDDDVAIRMRITIEKPQ